MAKFVPFRVVRTEDLISSAVDERNEGQLPRAASQCVGKVIPKTSSPRSSGRVAKPRSPEPGVAVAHLQELVIGLYDFELSAELRSENLHEFGEGVTVWKITEDSAYALFTVRKDATDRVG